LTALPTAALSYPESLNFVDEVHFGTDGWRAILRKDFNTATLARVAEAAAQVFDEEVRAFQETQAAQESQTITKPRIIIGYDCRENAGRYAVLVGTIIAAHGFEVMISNTYCPTPALCFSVARDEQALGGIMLTASHNPAEYLGVKLRMADGGASPAAFTDRVELALKDVVPSQYEHACAVAQLAINGTPETPATTLEQAPELCFTDLMSAYLDALAAAVDAEVIAAANLRVVVDPLHGAGRQYLKQTLERVGVTEVIEVNGADDFSFAGLHPEPIPPWIQQGVDAVAQYKFDACFVTDGDADRIGAADSDGTFVNPHRILALIIALLAEDKGLSGRVVRTLSGSNLVKRQCERLGLELTTTPIGFKWIYEEMLKGDVLIGGEESGGIGIPTHVRERDGLLMALLLTELMAQKKQTLKELINGLLKQLGNFDYARRDLRVSPEQKEAFLNNHVFCKPSKELQDYENLFAPLDENLLAIDQRDGLHLSFASDAWLLMRPSGTEPLVRVYAEATDAARVEELLDIGCALVEG